jgi:hypothetical protein
MSASTTDKNEAPAGGRRRRAFGSRPPSTRAVRDAVLRGEIARVHRDNFGVYGVRKVWRTLNSEGVPVARCTVTRNMTVLGLAGAVRGKTKRTRVSADVGPRPLDRRTDQKKRPLAGASTTSSSPPWSGSTGSTTDDCTATAQTFHLPSSNRTTSVRSPAWKPSSRENRASTETGAVQCPEHAGHAHLQPIPGWVGAASVRVLRIAVQSRVGLGHDFAGCAVVDAQRRDPTRSESDSVLALLPGLGEPCRAWVRSPTGVNLRRGDRVRSICHST